MHRFSTVRAGRRTFLAVLAGVVSAVLLVTGAAAARPSAAPGSFGPPFDYARDSSKCDDGEGTAVCTAASTPSTTGDITTSASLRPADVIASGRAEGRGGAAAIHKLNAPVKALRYRFVFDGVGASAATEPAIAQDLGARAFVGGFVWHERCSACRAQVTTLVADADPFTLEPESLEGGSYTVEVEVRNPAGMVPAGKLHALGYLLSDVGMYDGHSNFVSSGRAAAKGRLSQIAVVPLPA